MVLGERARRRTDGETARRASRRRPHAGDRARAEVRHRRAGAEPHHHRRRRDRRDRRRRCASAGEDAARQPRAAAGTGRAAAAARHGCARQSQDAGLPVPIAAPTNRVVYFPACPTRMFGAEQDATTICCRRPTAMMALLDPRRLRRGGARWARRPVLRPAVPAARASPRRPSGSAAGWSTSSSAGRRPRADRCLDLRQAPEGASRVGRHRRRQRRVPAGRGAAEAHHHCGKLPAVAVHQNCSAQRMNEQAAITGACRRPAPTTVAPLETVSCCGFAGDKGLFTPELNEWATRFVEERYSSGLRYRRLDRLDLRHRAQRARRHPVRVAGKLARIRLAARWPNRCLSPRTGPSPFCPYFGTCGGCTLQHFGPASYMALKQELVERALRYSRMSRPRSRR